MDSASQPDKNKLVVRTLSDGTADLDMLDQMLMDDGWMEFPDFSDVFQAGSPNMMSPFNSLSFSPLFEVSSNGFAQDGNDIPVNPSFGQSEKENTDRIQSISPDTIGQLIYSVQSGELHARSPSSEPGMSWRIQSTDTSSSVKDRFLRAINYIKESQSDTDVLVQLWVPVKREEHLVLTTYSQPFSLNQNCEILVKYREVSASYHFPAEKNSVGSLGLPGRVFLERLPEWTPDVRYFQSSEYPRVDYAKNFGVRGSIALPVFERSGHCCLGVVEVVMTTQKINYSYEVENICSALKAVNLRTSEVLTVPRLKVINAPYQAALPEILQVLKTICKMHMLPLAQTWIPCIQQGRSGCRHSDENYSDCVCTVDDTCYVNDLSVLGFHQACSEYHLFRGQGVAGQAFTTNQPCFSPDITSYTKIEYPLSHHARIFGLQGAVAIRLRSTCTGAADFVLEFFLPQNCIGIEEQKLMLDSLSSSVQNLSRTLRVVTARELEDEAFLHVNALISSDLIFQKSGPLVDMVQDDDNVNSGKQLELQTSGNVSVEVSAKQLNKSSDFEECGSAEQIMKIQSDNQDTVLLNKETLSNFEVQFEGLNRDSYNLNDSFCGDGSFPNNAKETKRRRRKTEKTISLQVLRNHFAGSLKDAAKNLGVCPTTLKRICRMHGITRWPSRKIKKVDHSLKKLQVVIDSVHGGGKAIQLSSLYKDFSMISASCKTPSEAIPISSSLQNNGSKVPVQQQYNWLKHHRSSSSHSSGSSQKSNPSPSCSSEDKHHPQNDEKLSQVYQANGNAELYKLQAQSCPDSSEGDKAFGEHCSSSSLSPCDGNSTASINVKATFGSDKVRLRLDPTWGFEYLKHEILKRFDIAEPNSVKFKYLDDDTEWVLITCDADLDECIRIHRSSGAQKIELILQPNVNSQTAVCLGS